MKGLLFTYMMTFGGAVISPFNPFIGLLIYICFAIVRPEWLWFWSVPPGNYSRIIGIGMLLGWAVHGFGDWRLGKAWPITAAFVGFWIWGAISATIAAFNAKVAWEYLDLQLKIVLPFLVGVTTINSVTRLKQLAWVLVLSLGYIALDANLSYLGGYNRVRMAGFGGMDNNGVAISMVAGAGMALFLAIGARRLWAKALALAVALLMAHVVLLAFSRGGLLALIICAVVSFGLVPKRPQHYLMFFLVVLIGIRLAGPEVLERFATAFVDAEQRDDSAESRLLLWKACWQVMREYPLFGLGPDHWPLVADRYGFSLGKEAHSLWLQTGAELGFMGVLLLFAFYSIAVARLLPMAFARYAVADPWLHDVARMAVASLVGFMAAASFVTVEAMEFPYYVTLVGATALKFQSAFENERQVAARREKTRSPNDRCPAASVAWKGPVRGRAC